MSAQPRNEQTTQAVDRVRTFLKQMEANRPVILYPRLARLVGVNAAVLLNHLLFWSDKGRNPIGWIYKSADELLAETGLTYRMQTKARERLLKFGFLEEKNDRIYHRMYFRVRCDALLSRLLSEPKYHAPNSLFVVSGNDLSADGRSDLSAVRNTDRTSESTPKPSPSSSEEEVKDISSREQYHSPEMSQEGSGSRASGAKPVQVPISFLPKSNDADFPRISGNRHPDWADAVIRFDPKASAFARLIPSFVWTNDVVAARMYYNRRRKGQIADRHIELLMEYFSSAICEGKPNWRPQSIKALLQGFSEVVAIVEAHVVAELALLNDRIAVFRDGDRAWTQAAFNRAIEVVSATPLPELKMSLQLRYAGIPLWAVCTALGISGDRLDLSAEEQKSALDQLAADPHGIELIKKNSLDIARALDFTLMDVEEERESTLGRLVAERERMRLLLGQPELAPSATEES